MGAPANATEEQRSSQQPLALPGTLWTFSMFLAMHLCGVTPEHFNVIGIYSSPHFG